MLTGVQVTFIGGDARQLEVIERLTELDAAVQLIGFDNLQSSFSGVTRAQLTAEALVSSDAIILPASGMEENGQVMTIFSSEELVLKPSHWEAIPNTCKIYTGIAKPALRKLCETYSIEVIELFERDDVAIYNSIPTAEGALMMAIQNTDFTIHNSKSMVLGMGRTGLTMARTLVGLGSQVKVGVRKPEHYARAWEMGFIPFYTKDLADHVKDIDLIFNTIPSMIITAQIIAKIPHRALIIDLASKPGGTDFRFAEKRGVKALLAPGLPGIVAPKTAGRIIANTLGRLLMDDSGKGGR